MMKKLVEAMHVPWTLAFSVPNFALHSATQLLSCRRDCSTQVLFELTQMEKYSGGSRMGFCSASVNLAACLRVCLCSAHSRDKDDNGLELVSAHTAWLACCDNEKLGI
jgi:hypothetical protein